MHIFEQCLHSMHKLIGNVDSATQYAQIHRQCNSNLWMSHHGIILLHLPAESYTLHTIYIHMVPVTC